MTVKELLRMWKKNGYETLTATQFLNVYTVVNALIKKEREECAKLCMPEIGKSYKEHVIDTMLDCEFAIRTRGQE